MRRGEIWTVSLPASGGREQSGERPAVVIQDSAYGQKSPLVIAVPLTSQQSASRFPGTVTIDPSSGNGLSTKSVAMIFQLRALDRSRFVERLGTLAAEDLTSVFAELDRMLGR